MAEAVGRNRGPKRRLGRGLGSLISSPIEVEVPNAAEKDDDADASGSPSQPDRNEPAKTMAAASIVPVAPAIESPAADRGSQLDGSATPAVEKADDSSPARASVESKGVDAGRNVGGDAGTDVGDRYVGANGEPVVRMLPLASIEPNPGQPRKKFEDGSLHRLQESIRENGVMQPIVVRPRGNGMYEIIAGERRWRAAQAVNLLEIPAAIHDLDDQTAAEWSLIENLQREDLNPIERAEAFRRLIDEHGLTHQMVADRLGQERPTISNHLRLLDLGEFVCDWVRDGELSFGHARCLLALANNAGRTRLAREAIKGGWSVRELEGRVRRAIEQAGEGGAGGAGGAGDGGGGKSGSEKTPAHAHIEKLQESLSEHLGTKVQIVSGKKKGTGKLVVEFFTFAQFEGVLESMGYVVEE
jgi:ParB family chromosome partitioning protein